MSKLSNRQRVATKGWLSITSDCDRSTGAIADEVVSSCGGEMRFC